MASPLTHLGDMPIDTFINEYWQKKPLLIKNALPDYSDIVSGDTLAGLSLEEGVVSRLIQHLPDAKENQWDVTHGPIDENTYANLPEKDWTLLVQHADQLLEDVNELKQLFNFLPKWRLDDVMISYSTDRAGVGPHYDYYDVFLLQGTGQRRWRTGQHCHIDTPLDPNAPMKVLKHFKTQNDWIVTQGDLLYIPPQCAHWGEAIGESITYSIGFRSPSHQDILLDYAQHISESLTQDKRFIDPKSQLLNPDKSQITQSSIFEIQKILHHYANNPNAVAAWLGANMTHPNPGEAIEHESTVYKEDTEDQNATQAYTLSPFVKAAYYQQTDNKEHAQLFIEGNAYSCDTTLAKILCANHPVNIIDMNKTQQNLLTTLIENHYLVYCDD